MTKQIILHIGPPKTGTTSLQYAFENLPEDKIFYGGVFQPRARNVGSLTNLLYSAVNQGNGPDRELVDRFNKTVLGIDADAILLSEEMFSLAMSPGQIESKIKNLSYSLSGYDVTIVLSVRSPSEGIPSLYQELYRSLSVYMQIKFELFCRSHIAKCFDYKYLVNELNNAGFNDISVVQFEDIRSGSVPLTIFPSSLELGNGSIAVSRYNVGAVGQDGGQRQLQRVTLKSFGRLSAVKTLLKAAGLRRLPGYRAFVGTLDRVSLAPDRMATLSLPEDIETQYENGYRALLAQHAQQRSVAGSHP